MTRRSSVEMGDREFHTRNGRHVKTFVPTGKMHMRGRGTRALLANPVQWESDAPTQAARLFVGMNVGVEPVWHMQDVIDLVRAVRTEQTGDPSSSFVAQKGIYAHEGGGPIVEEDAAQVIILNLGDAGPRAFQDQMIQLAEKLARELKQESVIVELQRGGMVEKTMGIVP